MKHLIKTIIRSTRQLNRFNSCFRIKDNNLKFIKKREDIKFLSFFYKLLFSNPNFIFGFFLTQNKSEHSKLISDFFKNLIYPKYKIREIY